MGKFWLNEDNFVRFLVQCLFDEFPEDQRIELEQNFGLRGQFVDDCNRYLERTEKAINKKILSVRGLTLRNVRDFLKLLTSPKLNEGLQNKFKETLVERLEGIAQELNEQTEALEKDAINSRKKAENLTGEIAKDVERMKAEFFENLARKLKKESVEVKKVAEEVWK